MLNLPEFWIQRHILQTSLLFWQFCQICRITYRNTLKWPLNKFITDNETCHRARRSKLATKLVTSLDVQK